MTALSAMFDHRLLRPASMVARAADRFPAVLAVALGIAAALAAALVATAPAALAQSSPAGSSAAGTDAAAAGGSSVGGVVFLFVSAVILGGALMLYLRHRQPRSERGGPAGTGGPSDPARGDR